MIEYVLKLYVDGQFVIIQKENCIRSKCQWSKVRLKLYFIFATWEILSQKYYSFKTKKDKI